MAQTVISESAVVLNADKPVDANAPTGPVLKMVGGIPMVSSLEVAAHFDKRHDHLLRAIQAIIRNSPESFSAPNFGAAEYIDAQGKPRISYDMTRDGFVVVAMGFTGKKAIAWKIAYVQAFNAMEAELVGRQEPSGTLTTSQQQELKELVQAKASAYPSQMYGRVISQIWTRLQRKFKVPRYSELPVALFGEARDYVIAMQVRSVDAPALEGTEAKALPVAAKPLSTIQDYASVFRGLPKDGNYWRDLSRRLVQAHDAFQGKLEAIKRDAIRPFRENRRLEVATFLDFATTEPFKRMFEIAEDGGHTAYRAAYCALLGFEGLHDLLLRG